MIDPGRPSLVVTEVIARLPRRLAEVGSNIVDTTANVPQNPAITSTESARDGPRERIEAGREKIAGEDTGLAEKPRVYEELSPRRG